MSLEVKTFDGNCLKEELFCSHVIVRKYVTELKRTLDDQVLITSKALTKIKQLEAENEVLKKCIPYEKILKEIQGFIQKALENK